MQVGSWSTDEIFPSKEGILEKKTIWEKQETENIQGIFQNQGVLHRSQLSDIFLLISLLPCSAREQVKSIRLHTWSTQCLEYRHWSVNGVIMMRLLIQVLYLCLIQLLCYTNQSRLLKSSAQWGTIISGKEFYLYEIPVRENGIIGYTLCQAWEVR